MPKKIFLIACEPSGDTHGSLLIRELKKLCPELQTMGLGGPKMRSEGMQLLEDMTKISALGFGDVIAKYFTYRKIFYRALAELEKFHPDSLILIDSPAFNLRFAKKVSKKFPVIYYISPQIWAWGGRRIHTIKKTISKMLAILPFEVSLYEKSGVPCEFVGHPLLDELQISKNPAALRKKYNLSEGSRLVGIFPGSRQTEIERILLLMLKTAKNMTQIQPDIAFILTRSNNLPANVYDKILKKYPSLKIHLYDGKLDDILGGIDFAFITSGTATLEATLIGTPFFLFYKASWSTYILGKMLIKVPYLGMVNLLAGKNVVPEFIQNDIVPEKIAAQAVAFLKDTNAQEAMRQEFSKVREQLGEKGASLKAASAVIHFLSTSAKK